MGADEILLAAFAFFAALVLALLIALVLQNRRISDANSALSELLSERLTAQSARASAELFKLNQSLNDGFNDKLYYLNRSLGEGLQRQNSALSENLSSLDRGFKDIAENLARMSEQNKTSLQVRDEIARLNSILGNVKLRGNFGEYRLERILSMIYGQNAAFYELQKHLPNGRIADCALHIAKEKILCIDSKFPLQSYEKIIAAFASNDAAALASADKQLAADMKKHAADIAEKYIIPPLS
ncbi:MAG: DNA recombination protein RmuC, partial [Campylobacter sp.]